jgi:hypothetical protein
MKRRFRAAGALLALVALSVWTSGSVFAAVCSAAPAGVVGHAAEHHDHRAGTMPHHDAEPSEAPADRDHGNWPCPAASGGAGGCVSLSVPAAGDTPEFGGAELRMAASTGFDHPDLAHAAIPFHPPRL